MRRIWRNALLIASLCLNVGFLSTFVIQEFRHGHHHSFPDLNLSAPAKAQFDANFSTYRQGMAPLHAELSTEKKKLMELLASENPSPEAIRAQQDKVTAVNARILQHFTDHILNQKRLLAPKQQRPFFDFIERRMQDAHLRPSIPFEEKHS